MDAELIGYLLKEYAHRLDRFDRLAYHLALGNIEPNGSQLQGWCSRMWPKLVAHGWLPDAEATRYFLAGDTAAFRSWLAGKIYNEHGGEALLNKCPRCQRLARTELARQCRHCGHDWH